MENALLTSFTTGTGPSPGGICGALGTYLKIYLKTKFHNNLSSIAEGLSVWTLLGFTILFKMAVGTTFEPKV